MMTSDGEGESVCLEKLKCLKELRCQQRSLYRMECHVQRCYDNYTACVESLKASTEEREQLEIERQLLVQRIHDIDSDQMKLGEISRQLEHEAQECGLSAPLSDYSQLLVDVNNSRTVLGLEPILESQAYINLSQKNMQHPAARHEQKAVELTDRRSSTRLKSGKSHKQCPHCFKNVPRNSISCSNCKGLCSISGWKKAHS